MSSVSVNDIENLFIDFDINLTQDLSHNLTCCLSSYLTDWDNLISVLTDLTDDLIDELTDDSVIKASTQLMTHEAEKDSILISENRDFCV